MRTTKLQHWEFKGVEPGDGYPRYFLPRNTWRPAVAPGHIHTDLVHHGIIADPFVGQAELGCQWVDRTPWTYRTKLDWQPHEDHPIRVLRFEGLDTVCEVFLNETSLAHHDNMFLPLEIDVSSLLEPGENELRIDFRPAAEVGLERRRAYFEGHKLDWQTGFMDERAFVRKAQYMSGWDWGPRLISCGIWQPVKLLEFAGRITDFQVRWEHTDGAYRVWSETSTEGHGDLITTFDGNLFEGEFDVLVVEPELWWPTGYGNQHLYVASARFGGHELTKRIGLRDIRLVRQPDKLGESFEFEVNGKRIWARGANWIPNDSFPSRIQDHEIEDQISTCAGLNFNMLRVWGGGLYESDAFYDSCDEKGILVWQDFAYACSYYPEVAPNIVALEGPAGGDARRLRSRELEGARDATGRLTDSATQEAEFQIKRLRHHASLALWCGNNENLAMHQQRWAGERTPDRYIGERIFSELLPSLLNELDPNRPYIPTSPVGPSNDLSKPCNDGGAGDQHFWDVWHGRGDWKHFADSKARFASEFGFPSSCSIEQWEEVLHADHWDTENETVRWHDKTGKPFEKWLEMVDLHYPRAATLEEWVYYSQLNQRDALRFAIEHYRTSEFCKGALIWQFNDCWPAQSWAVQDYARILKPARQELKRLFGPMLIAAKLVRGHLEIWAVNDGLDGKDCSICASIFTPFSSTCTTFKTSLASGERKAVGKVKTAGIDMKASFYLLSVDGEPGLDRWGLFDEPKHMRFGKPRVDFEILGNRLILQLTGVAFDAQFHDPDDRSNLRPLQPMPQNAINGELSFEFDRCPRKLVMRSLAGVQEIQIS